MLRSIFRTEDDASALVARLALGIVILPHGLQKLLGMFGGAGFTATVDYFVGSGLPAFLAVLIIIGEAFGALGLILGFLSRLAALGITIIMLGAILTVHVKFGFFMNWTGTQAGEGFEFHILAIGLALVVLIRGGGLWSVDAAITKA
ncbi:MAG TPA: DoxX family protein [Thermodesulfobacteriota bacterium]|nr:DoxX family protein [Thermodesulfobacteriota bacterium]